MDTKEQNDFLIDMLRMMIKDLIVYRTFYEREKQDGSSLRRQEIGNFLNQVRNDPGVKKNLGPDFAAFVEFAFPGGQRVASVILEAFLRDWTPRSVPN